MAEAAQLEALWRAAELSPTYTKLRGPEVGLVMTRGRMGGAGAAFNLGEASATRCSVRLADGVEGHAYVLGRAARKAEIAAVCDALMQTAAAEQVRARILDPLAARRAEIAEARRAETAPTKVEFFTMTRGDPDASPDAGGASKKGDGR